MCINTDKCLENACDQNCDVDNQGKVFCTCTEGYTLNEDQLTCTGETRLNSRQLS